jgi:hypothetical protein
MDRSVLLPPYMKDIQVWEDLIKIIDEVLGPNVDDPTVWVSQLRWLWIEASTAAAKIDKEEMLRIIDFEIPEKEIIIKQAKQLGFDFQDTDMITTTDYQRIVRNIALFWYSKGKPDFIDFLGFVLNSQMSIKNMWSTQGATWDTYGTMLPEGDAGIGTPIWEGGAWFPTTHVELVFDPFAFINPTFAKLTNLFYAIANYNLVLESVVLDGIGWQHSWDETVIARVAVAYPLIVIEMTIPTL